MAGKLFETAGGTRPGRSVFNLSYEKKFTMDMGELIPVMHDEVVPGDVVSLGNELVIRMQPMVAPVLHEINAFVHYFFVPYRLLDPDWEEFISGGADGASAIVLDRWAPADVAIGSLWDYFGFPTTVTPDADNRPLQFPINAYNIIYNTYYRDQTLIAEVPLTDEDVLFRSWEKDYFTSALPWQQRGTAPALPISGSSQALWPAVSGSNVTNFEYDNANKQPFSAGSKTALENNTVDLSSATTFDVADLRLAFQIQKWMERNARAGARYTEFLAAHFGVSPKDSRLDRPEFIAGSRTPVVISEVLQTSETGVTPQGTLAGHGITVDRQFLGKYRVEEFGMILGIMSIIPKPVY